MTQANNQMAEQQEREALVAEWLSATPGFFERHADLLANIQLKNPHGDRAISLQERQLGVLRQQNQALNQRLSDMLRFGSQNDKTQGLMIQWLSNLLTAKFESEVRAAISAGLAKIFDVDLVTLIDGEHNNFCGSKDQAEETIKTHLQDSVQSLAVINLAPLQVQILLTSNSAEKFTSDMGRLYLDQIGELALAALTRTKE